jgi:hypothetical protein
LIQAGQEVAERSGPLDGPRPPAPPAGGASIWLLTDGGIHLGSGPFGALAADPLGGPVIAAATELMRAAHRAERKRPRLTGVARRRRAGRVAVEVRRSRVHNPSTRLR